MYFRSHALNLRRSQSDLTLAPNSGQIVGKREIQDVVGRSKSVPRENHLVYANLWILYPNSASEGFTAANAWTIRPPSMTSVGMTLDNLSSSHLSRYDLISQFTSHLNVRLVQAEANQWKRRLRRQSG
jgi:hypothetical protein